MSRRLVIGTLIVIVVALHATVARADLAEKKDPDDKGPGMALDIERVTHGHGTYFGTRVLNHLVLFHDDVVFHDLTGTRLRFSTDGDRRAERELRFVSTRDGWEVIIFNMKGRFRGFGEWGRGCDRCVDFVFQRSSLSKNLDEYTWWAVTEDEGACDDVSDEPDPNEHCVDRSPRLTHRLK